MGRGTLHKGFTLLELIVVVAIIAVLFALILPNASALINRAQRPVCSARLVNLWITFSANLHDGNPWPQVPTNITIGSLEEERWWLDTTSNSMNLTKKEWNCPTIERLINNSTNASLQPHVISYLPALFDSLESTPNSWPTMPWFVEIANVHGSGAQMVRADGAVVCAQTLKH